MRIYIDCETYSSVDLKKCGSARYAADHSTGLNCICYAIDDGPIITIPYGDKSHFREALWNALGNKVIFPNTKVIAHNAAFEENIFSRVLSLMLPPHHWIDTMAKAMYYGYPMGLDDVAQALQCEKMKDIQGKAVMQKLAKGKIKPTDDPAAFERLYQYCGVDVEVMRMVDKKLPDLPPEVQERWETDMEINMRGVPIDLVAVNNAVQLREIFVKENNEKMQELTGGAVSTVGQVEAIQKHLAWCGVDLPDMTADSVSRALGDPTIQGTAREILQLRQESGLSSLAKFEKMLNYQVDGRLYGMFMWYGAHTGRPTGSGPQVMNMPRSEDPEYWAELLASAPFMLAQVSKPMEKLKAAARGTLCASPGSDLVWIDLSQIEARATGWLADEKEFLDLFLTSDPYCTYGKTIFNREITKKDNPIERTASKASMLSLGFAGGIGAYQRVGENYHIDFEMVAQVVLPSATPSELAEAHRCHQYYLRKKPVKPLSEREGLAVDILKQRYRRDFKKIVAYWDELQEAFFNGGWAGKIHIDVRNNGLRVLTLPSSRQLFYHNVKAEWVKKEDEETGEAKMERKFSYQDRNGRKWFWKGTLIENCAQGVNADISDFFKVIANREIAPVVHHCYDEFTTEVPTHRVEEVKRQLHELTTTVKPNWAEGLPLGFDTQSGRRYGK